MKNIKKLVTASLLSVIYLAVLTGCSDLESNSTKEEEYISYQKMKEQNKETYPLLYFENVANSFRSDPSYALGYKDNGTVTKKTFDGGFDHYKEIVDPDLDVPYVVIYDRTYYIHRPPYYSYNQEKVEGEVSEKE